jgi:hypothetical protein
MRHVTPLKFAAAEDATVLFIIVKVSSVLCLRQMIQVSLTCTTSVKHRLVFILLGLGFYQRFFPSALKLGFGDGI